MTEKIILLIAGAVISAIFAIIAFFLKRVLSEIDVIKREHVSKTGLDRFEESIKADIRVVKSEHKERIDKLAGDIEDIKEDYITKDDFFREQAETDRKLDRILDILMERRSGDNG